MRRKADAMAFGMMAFGAMALGVLLSVAAAEAGRAADEDVRRPKVPFTGDLVVERPGERPVRIRLSYGVTRLRMDVPWPDPRVSTVIDRLRRTTVILLPRRREFVTLPAGAYAGAMTDRLTGARGGLERVGPDRIRGIAVTRYALKTRTAAGTAFEGHVWLTGDDIMIRTAGRTPKGPIDISLHNLQRGAVAPALFAIPPGYTERKPGGD